MATFTLPRCCAQTISQDSYCTSWCLLYVFLRLSCKFSIKLTQLVLLAGSRHLLDKWNAYMVLHMKNSCLPLLISKLFMDCRIGVNHLLQEVSYGSINSISILENEMDSIDKKIELFYKNLSSCIKMIDGPPKMIDNKAELKLSSKDSEFYKLISPSELKIGDNYFDSISVYPGKITQLAVTINEICVPCTSVVVPIGTFVFFSSTRVFFHTGGAFYSDIDDMLENRDFIGKSIGFCREILENKF